MNDINNFLFEKRAAITSDTESVVAWKFFKRPHLIGLKRTKKQTRVALFAWRCDELSFDRRLIMTEMQIDCLRFYSRQVYNAQPRGQVKWTRRVRITWRREIRELSPSGSRSSRRTLVNNVRADAIISLSLSLSVLFSLSRSYCTGWRLSLAFNDRAVAPSPDAWIAVIISVYAFYRALRRIVNPAYCPHLFDGIANWLVRATFIPFSVIVRILMC